VIRSRLIAGLAALCAITACSQFPDAVPPLRKTVVPPGSPALSSSLDAGITFQFVAPGTLSRANAVNDAGLVVGDYGGNNIAAVWTATGGTVTIGNTDGSISCCSSLLAVNRHGEATGTSATGGLNVVMTWLQSSGIASNLGNLPGGQNTRGIAINDQGDIAGHDDADGGTPYFKPNGGAMIRLDKGTFPGVYVTGMNNGGAIVALARESDAIWRAARWSHFDAPIADLGNLGGDRAEAMAVNAGGDIVGWSELTSGDQTRHAVLWPATGGMIDLNTWPQSCAGNSDAAAINDDGVIAGRCNGLPVLWTAVQGMRTLPLPTGFTTGEPHGLNHQLQIVGTHDGFGGAMWTVSNHAPLASAGGPYFGTTGSRISLDASASSDSDGGTLTYAWDFGDGSMGTGVRNTHHYAQPGAYVVHLSVTDPLGATGTATTTTSVEAPWPLVTAGEKYSCAIGALGTVSCWGASPYGASNVPGDVQFTQLTAGFATTCGIRGDASIACYGSDGTGQNLAPAGAYAEVTMGQYHACALAPDLSAHCWGGNSFHEQDLPAARFAQLSAGYLTTCAILTDGTLACAGDGYGSNGGSWAPPTGTFVQVSATDGHACALRNDRSVVCWGDNATGRVGGDPSSGFITVDHRGTFREVRTGPANSCALAVDGSLSCWGYNVDGRSSPPAGTFVQLAVGSSQGCAMRADATVACWGDNTSGQSTPPPSLSGAPTANPGGPYTAAEGAHLVFDGSGSTGTGLSYAWSFGDGATGAGAHPHHAYANNGSFAVTLVVTGNNGVASAPASTSVAVTNVPPTGRFTAPVMVAENVAFTIGIRRLVDPGSADDEQYAFDCGGGLGYGAWSATNSWRCTPADNGSVTVHGKVRDDDGGESAYTATVVVTNVAPRAAFQQTPHSVKEGSPFVLTLANPNDVAADLPGLQYAFDCDDPAHPGFSPASGTNTFTCSTSDNGVRHVHGRIADKDGDVTDYADSVSVTNVTPVVSLDSIPTAGLPPMDTRVWFHFTDPGASDGGLPNHYWQVSLDCGNGNVGAWQLTPNFEEALECTYAAPGLYTVTVQVTDKDGAIGSDSKKVRIR
jgi:probable HAF family extracellular repeat protein